MSLQVKEQWVSQLRIKKRKLSLKENIKSENVDDSPRKKRFHQLDSEDEQEPVCDEQKSMIIINNQSWSQNRPQPGGLIQASAGMMKEETKSSKVFHTSPRIVRKPAVIEEPSNYIPCLYLPYEDCAQKIVIYFHGNAEDIGLAYDLLFKFGTEMGMHVLAVEYPGYGLYKMCPPDENQIKEDAEILYLYLTRHIGIKDSDIILFGRSMGSGPATYLASKYQAYTLLLMSPYTSIKDVAKTLLGKLSFLLTPLIYERFRNIDAIKQAKCPSFILHGLQDTLIPHSHAQELHQNCPTVSYLQLARGMDHNEFDFSNDLIQPFKDYIKRLQDQTYFADDNVNESQKTSRTEVERESFVTFYSNIDESCVDYSRSTHTFDIIFDSKLYEAPKVVAQFEYNLVQEAKLKGKGSKGK